MVTPGGQRPPAAAAVNSATAASDRVAAAAGSGCIGGLGQVDVAVDQAGQQPAAVEVDDGVVRAGTAAGHDRGDPVAVDADVEPHEPLAVGVQHHGAREPAASLPILSAGTRIDRSRRRAMGRVDGKVALITGAARGQGRCHAVRLAEEGADIIAIDLCDQIGTVHYDMPTADDLAETKSQVEALGRRAITAVADVRDTAALRAVVDDGVAQLGRLDIIVANAGIFSFAPVLELSEEAWRDVIDVNLTGVWRTCVAAIPAMIAAGNGGSVILTSSAAGLAPFRNTAHYVTSKYGVVGLMKCLALELGEHRIRVNSVNPTTGRHADGPQRADAQVVPSRLRQPDDGGVRRAHAGIPRAPGAVGRVRRRRQRRALPRLRRVALHDRAWRYPSMPGC